MKHNNNESLLRTYADLDLAWNVREDAMNELVARGYTNNGNESTSVYTTAYTVAKRAMGRTWPNWMSAPNAGGEAFQALRTKAAAALEAAIFGERNINTASSLLSARALFTK